MSRNHKITEKASKKCTAEDLFTFVSDDVIPGKHLPVTDSNSENAECRSSFRFIVDEK